MNETVSKGELIKRGIRSIGASVPIVASIGQAWAEYESAVQERRINELFQNLKDELERVNARVRELAERIDDPEGFSELLERAIDSVQRSRSAEKRKRFARALAVFATMGPELRHEQKLDLLDALDTLTEEDLKVLDFFELGKPVRVNRILNTFPGGNSDAAVGNVARSLAKLEARAVIGRTTGPDPVDDAFVHFGEREHWTNRWRGRYYEILPFGADLRRAIKD